MSAEQTPAARAAAEAASAAAREAGVIAPVTFDEVTESTNSTAMRLAAEGAPEWSVVVAGHQTGGRGRLGRTWVSEPGDALLCSVILRPEGLAAEDAGLLTLLAGVAMTEASRVALGVTVGCKWPNDIMVGERKAGGLLAESLLVEGRLEAVVIGAGVNVRRAPSGVADATALGGPEDDPSKLMTAFLFCLKQRYQPGSATFASEVLAPYRKVCDTIGRRVRAQTTEGEQVEGRAVDVDDRGNLQIEVESDGGGIRTVAFGDIAHMSE